MAKLGKALLIVSAVYTSYYIGKVSGYINGTLVTCKAFVERDSKSEESLDMVKKAQEESNGQGSGN